MVAAVVIAVANARLISVASTSGVVTITSSNAGHKGASGLLSFSSGTASSGTSGPSSLRSLTASSTTLLLWEFNPEAAGGSQGMSCIIRGHLD